MIDLKETYKPTRIVIETSGSAFPATLAMVQNCNPPHFNVPPANLLQEVNRISESHPNAFTLDGVIQVLDVENWTGYADTSFTAKLQSKYTDLIVLNKHELAGLEREELVLDRIRDVAEETPIVKTTHGKIDASVIFGIDSSLAKNFAPEKENAHAHVHDHNSEVDVISLRLPSALTTDGGFIDATALRTLLTTAPKDEVYRIKGIIRIAEGEVPLDPNAIDPPASHTTLHESWILNWAFGRWTFTPLRESSVSTTIEAPNLALPQAPFMNGVRKGSIEVLVQTSISTTVEETAPAVGDAARLNFVVARGEGERWTRKLQQAIGGLKLRSGEREGLVVTKLGT